MKGLMVLISLVIVISLGGIYIKHHHTKNPSSLSIASNKSVAIKKNDVDTTSRFAFYSLLPKMEVGISQNPTNVPATITPTPNTSTPTPTLPPPGASHSEERYFLQVASSQNLKEAQRFKDRIAAMGFITTIQPFQRADGIWNRVLIGPYNNLTDAQRAQSALHQKGINSLMLRAKSVAQG